MNNYAQNLQAFHRQNFWFYMTLYVTESGSDESYQHKRPCNLLPPKETFAWNYNYNLQCKKLRPINWDWVNSLYPNGECNLMPLNNTSHLINNTMRQNEHVRIGQMQSHFRIQYYSLVHGGIHPSTLKKGKPKANFALFLVSSALDCYQR